MAEIIFIVSYLAAGLIFALWVKAAVVKRGKIWLVSGPYAPIALTVVVAIWLPLVLAAVLTEIFEVHRRGQ